jgi:ABC-2 type transport system ATP-binding protein
MLAIEVSDLKKSYGSLKAVDGISLNVKAGEIFSMLGPNGAGKTTTVEILEGLRHRDSGSVSVLELDPWKQGYELHRKIGVIPQGFAFFDKSTPREAIKYYGDLFDVPVDPDQILREVILEDAANNRYENLSGGQKQKVGLALALVNNPELLFLDEPTTGLDPQARRAVWEVIRNLKKAGRTIVLTTHYLEEAEHLADRVAIMNKGRIIAAGSPLDLIAQYSTSEHLRVTCDRSLYEYVKANTNLEAQYDDQQRYLLILLRNRGDAVAAFDSIVKSNQEWSDLSTERDSLEDIFIKLVGVRLDEEGSIPETTLPDSGYQKATA